MAEVAAQSQGARIKGSAEKWDREKLALLAVLTLGDVENGVRLWQRLAPVQFRQLVLAEPVENIAQVQGTKPKIWFDMQTQRFGLGDRGFIQIPAMLDAVDKFRESAIAAGRASMAAVLAGNIEVSLWQNDNAAELKALAAIVEAMGVGGKNNLTAEALAAAQDEVKFHLERLSRFAVQLAGGIVTPSAAIRRAGMYPESIVTSEYHAARQFAHGLAGFAEEMNVLDPTADHCEGRGDLPGCQELTDQGWVELDSLEPPGERACMMNCRCHLDFRR